MKKSLKNFEEIKNILCHKDLLHIKGGAVTNQCTGNHSTTTTECNEAPPVPYDDTDAGNNTGQQDPKTRKGRVDITGN